MASIVKLCPPSVVRFALGILCALPSSGSVTACKANDLTWALDGTVSRGSRRLATKIQSVTAAMEADGGLYLGGYQIDSANVNHPRVAFIPASLDNERYWAREDSIQSFFIWKKRINLLESSGKAFERYDDDWRPTDLQFKPKSVVIMATDVLIACNPRPLPKASKER